MKLIKDILPNETMFIAPWSLYRQGDKFYVNGNHHAYDEPLAKAILLITRIDSNKMPTIRGVKDKTAIGVLPTGNQLLPGAIRVSMS